MKRTTGSRFAAKLDMPRGLAGCWTWTGVHSGDGYGRFHCPTRRRMVVAHRWLWERLFGPVPERHVLDHLCRNRSCVNPAHLEAVSQRENLLRGDTSVRAHFEGRDCGHDRCVSCAHRRAA